MDASRTTLDLSINSGGGQASSSGDSRDSRFRGRDVQQGSTENLMDRADREVTRSSIKSIRSDLSDLKRRDMRPGSGDKLFNWVRESLKGVFLFNSFFMSLSASAASLAYFALDPLLPKILNEDTANYSSLISLSAAVGILAIGFLTDLIIGERMMSEEMMDSRLEPNRYDSGLHDTLETDAAYAMRSFKTIKGMSAIAAGVATVLLNILLPIPRILLPFDDPLWVHWIPLLVAASIVTLSLTIDFITLWINRSDGINKKRQEL